MVVTQVLAPSRTEKVVEEELASDWGHHHYCPVAAVRDALIPRLKLAGCR